MHWEIHPPRSSRFPSGGDFAPRGPRDCPRAKPEGNLEGRGVQNPRPREISRASGDVFPNTSLLSAVYGYNIPSSGSIPKSWSWSCGGPDWRRSYVYHANKAKRLFRTENNWNPVRYLSMRAFSHESTICSLCNGSPPRMVKSRPQT